MDYDKSATTQHDALKRKKVCDDMLQRLESQVAVVPPVPWGVPQPTPPDQGQALAAIEERIKELQEKLESTLKSKAEPEPERMSDAEAADKIASDLQEIVDTFNNQLDSWYKKTGCVVNFAWSYTGVKKLEIAGIDYIVYRKPAPSEKTLKEALAQAQDKK